MLEKTRSIDSRNPVVMVILATVEVTVVEEAYTVVGVM